MRIMEDPYPDTPGERDLRIAEVRAHIAAMRGLPGAFRAELLEHATVFVTATLVDAPGDTHFYGGQLGWKRWFIRNDHLDLVATLGTLATALAAFTAPAEQKSQAAAFPIAAAVASVGYRLKQKGATLDEGDYAVLMALKRFETARISWLAHALSATSGRTWTEDDVAAALGRLSAVRVGDGSIEAFAVLGRDDLWSPNGC